MARTIIDGTIVMHLRQTLRPTARCLCLALWFASWQLVACSSSDDANSATDADVSEADASMDVEYGEVGADGELEVGPIEDGSLLEGALDSADAGEDGDSSLDGFSDAPDAPEDAPDDALDDAADAPDDASDAESDGEPADAALKDKPTCYYGDFETDGTHTSACLAFPGPVRTLLDSPEMVGEWISGVAVSPQGDEAVVAVRASANEPLSVQVVRLDGTAPTRELLEAPLAENQITSLAYSADGSRLGLLADFELLGTQSLYAIPIDGGTPIRVSLKAEEGKNVTGFAWAPAAGPGVAWLAFTGDLVTAGVHGLWAVNTGIFKPQPQAIVSDAQLGTNGDVQSDIAWDADGHVVFRSNHDSDGVFNLYRACNACQIELVPGASLTNGDGSSTVGSFGLSPDGLSVAFSTNSPNAAVFEVFVVGLHAGADPAVRVSAVTAVSEPGTLSGPAFQTPIVWSENGERLAVVADWRSTSNDRDDSFSAFVLPSMAPASGRRVLGAPQGIDLNVRECRFSHVDGSLIVRGDLVENGTFELFVVSDLTIANQNPLDVRFEEVPPLGDVLGLAVGP